MEHFMHSVSELTVDHVIAVCFTVTAMHGVGHATHYVAHHGKRHVCTFCAAIRRSVKAAYAAWKQTDL